MLVIPLISWPEVMVMVMVMIVIVLIVIVVVVVVVVVLIVVVVITVIVIPVAGVKFSLHVPDAIGVDMTSSMTASRTESRLDGLLIDEGGGGLCVATASSVSKLLSPFIVGVRC
jgi:hypothetical protein